MHYPAFTAIILLNCNRLVAYLRVYILKTKPI